MLKNIFIRQSDSRLRFIWKFAMIIGMGILIGKLFGMLIGYLIIMYFAAVKGKPIEVQWLESNPIVIGFTSIAEQLIMISIITFFIYKIDKLNLEKLGAKFEKKSIIDLGFGLLFGAIAMAMVLVIFIILDKAGIGLIRNIQFNGFGDAGFAVSMVFVIILFMLVAFQEELLCRGYMVSDLKKIMPAAAIFVPAAAFSLMHLRNDGFSFDDQRKAIMTGIALLNIFLIGLIFGVYFYFTRDLWLVIGVHFSWNFVQGSVLGFNVSGIETASLFDTSLSVNRAYTVFTGGILGPEGGIIVTCVLVLLALMMSVYAKCSKIPGKEANSGCNAGI